MPLLKELLYDSHEKKKKKKRQTSYISRLQVVRRPALHNQDPAIASTTDQAVS